MSSTATLSGPPTREAASGTSRPPRRAGVLLDRDGTIIVDHGYVGSPERVELIKGAAGAIRSLNRASVPVAVVTNQAGVARGYFDVGDVERVHRRIAAELAEEGAEVDCFLFCPYHPDGVVDPFTRHSEDRKPRPGMAIAAAMTLNLDLTASWVVGDRDEDVELAAAIGASPVRIGEGPPTGGVPSFRTLADAVPYILGHLAP